MKREIERKFRNEIMAKTNELADIIRKHKKISFGQLCVEGHIAPSTLYNYKRILTDGDTFKDIIYEKGKFTVKKKE